MERQRPNFIRLHLSSTPNSRLFRGVRSFHLHSATNNQTHPGAKPHVTQLKFFASLAATELADNAKISTMNKKKKKKPTSSRNSTPSPVPEPTNKNASRASQKRSYREPVFAQYFSFVLLLLAIVLVSVLFYEVMVAFWIPLFLAAVLVVVFRPWYNWLRNRFKLGDAISALLTALSVLLIVLVPLGALLVLAVVESQQVLKQFNSVQVLENAEQIRTKLGLELPIAVTQTQSEIETLAGECSLDTATENRHQASLFEIQYSTDELADFWNLKRPSPISATGDSEEKSSDADKQLGSSDQETPLEDLAEVAAEPASSDDASTTEPWEKYLSKLAAVNQLHGEIAWANESPDGADSPTINRKRFSTLHDYRLLIGELEVAFNDFIVKQLGGKTRAWAATLLNPTEEQSEVYIATVTEKLRSTLFVFGGKGLTYILLMVGGSIVMIVSFYFFLLDGQSMISAFKRLSPLDDEHEQELVDQFSKVSRAVVVATLLSALVQGLLAGVGFYVAGLESIFLLTVLSAVLAMVPFLGAASVWIPCSLYLYFIDNNMTAAIGLAIYGAAVISMADNIIKPLVLHGQSKLHPLFAFLSVIGGLAMLGPIGILIGPMIIAFMQTLLEILHSEVQELEKNSATAVE